MQCALGDLAGPPVPTVTHDVLGAGPATPASCVLLWLGVDIRASSEHNGHLFGDRKLRQSLSLGLGVGGSVTPSMAGRGLSSLLQR